MTKTQGSLVYPEGNFPWGKKKIDGREQRMEGFLKNVTDFSLLRKVRSVVMFGNFKKTAFLMQSSNDPYMYFDGQLISCHGNSFFLFFHSPSPVWKLLTSNCEPIRVPRGWQEKALKY